MRAFFKNKNGVGLAVLVLLVIAVAVGSVQFYIMEMGSTSMEPLISGQGDPPSLVVIHAFFLPQKSQPQIE